MVGKKQKTRRRLVRVQLLTKLVYFVAELYLPMRDLRLPASMLYRLANQGKPEACTDYDQRGLSLKAMGYTSLLIVR